MVEILFKEKDIISKSIRINKGEKYVGSSLVSFIDKKMTSLDYLFKCSFSHGVTKPSIILAGDIAKAYLNKLIDKKYK